MNLRPEQINAIYITAIWHIVVIIVLLLVTISYEVMPDKGILMDFSAEEEREHKERIREEAARLLEEHLIEAGLRNLVVDNGSELPDGEMSAEERRQLYSDMARIDAGILERENAPDEDEFSFGGVQEGGGSKSSEDEVEYHGPSVAYYTLTGRKATKLKIPAYQCVRSGEVMLAIAVDPNGKVLDAWVMEEGSSTDECLREEAVKAAMGSRFNVKTDAPIVQYGDIRYRFIAQEP